MNISRTTGLAFALSFLTASSAFAANMVQKLEPNNGFTKGENPEWSLIHTDSKDFDAEHRMYQKNAEAKRLLWLKENMTGVGTPEYVEAKREFLQHRNLMHRLWVLQQTKGISAGSLKPWQQPEPMVKDVQQPELMVKSTDLNLDTSFNTRTFSGNAPSRRAIVRATDDRNKTRALTVGY